MSSKGALEMLGAMAICGTIGITVMASGQEELSLIFYRCLFGALVLFAVCTARRYLRRDLLTFKMVTGSLIGGAALIANWYFLFASYEKTSIGVATTVYNIQPIIMIALGFFLFKEKITANVLVWTGVSLVGLLFISKLSGDDFGAGKASAYLIGVMQALLAAALYAVAAVFARLLKGNPPTLIALLQLLLGVAILWPYADLDLIASPMLDKGTIATVLLGVVHTGFMYILLYGALQKIEAYRAASISFIYPALAIAIDAGFLGVSLSVGQWVGIGMILLGAAGINLKWSVSRFFRGSMGGTKDDQSQRAMGRQ
ncbi:hypothetical protein BJP27_04285 [Pseudomonas oryzihabitans]|nr:hypothetical protein BJP27_04285 [Pseudomonas psychrotolerans]